MLKVIYIKVKRIKKGLIIIRKVLKKKKNRKNSKKLANSMSEHFFNSITIKTPRKIVKMDTKTQKKLIVFKIILKSIEIRTFII